MASFVLAAPAAPQASAPAAAPVAFRGVVRPACAAAPRASIAAVSAAAAAAAGLVAATRAARPRGLQGRQRRLVGLAAAADGAAPILVPPGGSDRIVRYMGGNVSVRACVATELVREACAKHGTSPIASVALGRALMGTALLSSGRDEGETLQLRIQGGGPGGTLIAESDWTLRCRAFLAEPTAEADSVPELLGVGGDATLRVSRMHPYWKQPYTGTIGLQTGEVAEDIVQYLALSEQTPASMGLSVEWDNETGSVLHAEGFLITLLPGWQEEEVGAVEANIGSFAQMQDRGLPRPEAICEHMMANLSGTFQLEEKVHWGCKCSKQKLLTATMMLGKQEVGQILRDNETINAKCDWCGTKMSLTPEEIADYLSTDVGREQVESRSASPRQLKLQDDELKAMPEAGQADWS